MKEVLSAECRSTKSKPSATAAFSLIAHLLSLTRRDSVEKATVRNTKGIREEDFGPN